MKDSDTHAGFSMDMGSLSRLSSMETRSISAENVKGEKGSGGMAVEGTGAHQARDLGPGWKIYPAVHINGGDTFEVADIEGPGVVQHIWMTNTGSWRDIILRIYWDGQDNPSVECPIGDFFANAWGSYSQIDSLAVCTNPGRAFNCYWPMPFRKRCRITAEYRGEEHITLFYQVDYALGSVPEDAAYFHAQFRRTNPLPYGEVYTIVDGIEGKGHYVGTYIALSVNNNGWWGEGEISFYMDGDDEFPTICGTGAEDYFCGSYGFEVEGRYQEYTTPYAGMPQVIRPDGLYSSQERFSLYRWHIMDPVRFEEDLRVTIQALGWRSGGRYLPMQDDYASVAYWYQTLPAAPFPELPGRDELEII